MGVERLNEKGLGTVEEPRWKSGPTKEGRMKSHLKAYFSQPNKNIIGEMILKKGGWVTD